MEGRASEEQDGGDSEGGVLDDEEEGCVEPEGLGRHYRVERRTFPLPPLCLEKDGRADAEEQQEKGHGAETTGQQHNFSFCLLPLQQVDAKSIKFLKGLLERASPLPLFSLSSLC